MRWLDTGRSRVHQAAAALANAELVVQSHTRLLGQRPGSAGDFAAEVIEITRPWQFPVCLSVRGNWWPHSSLVISPPEKNPPMLRQFPHLRRAARCRHYHFCNRRPEICSDPFLDEKKDALFPPSAMCDI